MKTRILVADGDEQIRNELEELLTTEGYGVDLVSDGISVLKYFRRYEYDLVILDYQLPELDGKSVCRQLRKMADVPFAILSNNDDEASKLNGFSLGADDYMIKPYSGKELLARVKVILRRHVGRENVSDRNLIFGPLQIDTIAHTVYVHDHQVTLTPKEYELLVLMAKNPDQAFSREMLLNEIWGHDYYGTDRTVDTHIKTLREALKPCHHFIATVRGFGYKFIDSQQEVPHL